MKKGVTILEVLVSMAVLAIISASIFPVVGWLINRTYKYQYDGRAAAVLLEGAEAAYAVLLAESELAAVPEDAWTGYVSGQHYQPVPNGSDDAWELIPGES
ncbi:MAG: prepilin-type N-terminal cleavage/methylation domain-containing protein, partial [candidate division Zixibacteria bacterium]|nr:prepilin-type N-terminal cleavage/methylation domain-containing protein [candidate division Zixibacteria bacterium]